MAGDKAVLNFLDVSEQESIPLSIKTKLEEVISKYHDENDDLKVKYERLRVNSEQQYFDVEKQLVSSNNKLESETSTNAELKDTLAQLEQKYKEVSEKFTELGDTQEGSLTSQLQLTRSNEQLEAEKRDLTVLLEKKNKELDRLNDEWKDFTEKLSKANTAKFEAQAKLSDMQSSMVTIEFQSKRLQQENEQMKGQIDWLNKELGEKTKELMNNRKEQSSKLIDLQTQLEEKTEELRQLTNSMETLRKTNSDQAQRIDKLIQKSKDVCDSQIQSEEQFRQELEAKSKLSELYRTSAEEAEEKIKELSRAVDELQKLLRDSANDHTNMEKEKDNEIEKLNKEIEDRESGIRLLKQELVNANDLIDAARKKNATDQQVDSMFPSAAATSKYLKSGMTLTQIYNAFVNVSDELMLEKEENKRLQQYLDDILHEIEEKAPVLKKQKEDYVQALQNIDQLTKQLDSSLLENQNLRSEADESIRKFNHMQRENHKYQQQMLDLSHQVQFLVKEIEEVKTGRIVRSEDANVSSSEISSSCEAISSKLVTFRDIEDLQRQNQRLIAVIRELSEKKEEEEKLATESKTKELKDQLYIAHNELKELKMARDRQQEMVEAIVNQRDMYKVLAQETAGTLPHSFMNTPKPSRSVSASLQSPVTSMRSPGLDKTMEETKVALKQMTEDFSTYKKERSENERMLNEQIDKTRQNQADTRVQNAKLASQLDFQAERYKVLLSNNEGYKKEIASLREKVQKYSTSVAKHEQTVNTLRQDAMSSQENLARAQAQAQNFKMEKELLKSSEGRLLQEIESHRRERQSQSMLMANLEAIKNNLERSEFDTKTRYSNKIESLEMEVNTLKRKLKAEEDEHRALNTLWEKQTKSLRSQLEQTLKEQESYKSKCTALEKEKQQLKQQTVDLEYKLKTAEQTLANRGTVAGMPAIPSLESSTADQETIKDLRLTIEQSNQEIKNLQDQLQHIREQKQQYMSISEGLQKTVAEHTDVAKEFEQSRQQIMEEMQRAKQLAERLQKEKQQLMNENIRLSEDSHTQNADIRKKLDETQIELQEAVERREVAICNEMVAVEESSVQSKLAAETQDKYQRELILHAADVETLTVVKRQLEEFNTRLATERDIRIQAERKLEEHLSSSSEREGLMKVEIERIEQRNRELTNQNKLLHEQMEKMSKEMLSVQAAVTRRESLNTSFGEETSKSSEQLLEVIKFLRKEKDIAESRLDVVQAETARIKQRNELLHREIEDINKVLAEEREQSQASLQTAAKHAELMKKVENLNLLTDSNKLLREEKDKLQQEMETLEAKVNKLERDINPMMQTIRDKQVTIDTLAAEKNALKTEVDRWKARTSHLIEQSNKSDPEEKKRLIQERENLKKELSGITEENHRQKAEISRTNQSSQNMQTELTKSNQNVLNAQQEITSLKTEIENLKKKLQTTEQDLQTKTNEDDTKQKTIVQLKKIGRKYKEQTEIISKEMEDLKQKLASQEEQQPSAAALEQATSSFREQLTNTEKERDELKMKVEQNENESKQIREQEMKIREKVQEELDKLKTDHAKVKEEKDDHEKKVNQSKQVLLTARKKIGSQNEEIQNQNAELEKLRQKIKSEEESSNVTEGRLKSHYESRITSLEKELSELKESAVAASQVPDLKTNIDRLEKEKSDLQNNITEQKSKIVELQNKIQQLQKPPKAVAPKTQVARPSPTVAVEGTSQSSEAPPPKTTAPIRPIASPVARAHPTPSQTQANMKATASIRPMPSPLSVAITTPTATVMPTTVSHQEPQEDGVPAAQISPVTTTTRPTQQVQRVIPQQELSDQSLPDSESSQPETVVVEPQQSTSIQQTTVVTPMTQTAVATTLVQPTIQPSTSAGTSREGATKRTREDSAEEETEAKRSKVIPHQEAQVIPSIVVTESSDRLQEQLPDYLSAEEETQTEEQTLTGLADDQTQTSEPATLTFTEEDLAGSQQQSDNVDTANVEEEEGDDDDGIIILDEDNEESGEEEYGDENEGDDEDEVEEEEVDIYEDMDEYHDAQEGDEPIQEDDYQGDGDMEEEEDYSVEQEDDMQDDQRGDEEEEEEDDDDAVVVIESDEEDSRMEAQEVENQPTTQANTVSVQPVMLQQQAQPIERQTSVTRAQLTPFIIGSQGYEDGEDGIVPSTPTLYIPMRGDGFAEAISSPMVQQRFTFGLSSSESHSDLAQLESQRACGMDDTRMDLSQLQEGSGRSVPSTPLRTTAPVSISESALAAAAAASQSASESIQGTEESHSTQDVPGLLEEQTEPDSTDTGDNAQGVDDTDGQPGTSADLGEQDGASRDDTSDRSDEKPKIQPIVWEAGAAIRTQTGHTGPSFRSRPPRRGQPPYQGHTQQRGRGQFSQRGRSPVPRSTRGGARGSRGGMFRSPNMY
ncbi:nucleoprotein TPR-like isoform X2 [Mytilus trossulus]|uniref:nucleoprotein TPR-like isoform X2 n=1 Tax=Mytilus trossulus TaxID=6551 RepID=UPI0030051137